jgi:RND family efflux transporter MFP subunit
MENKKSLSNYVYIILGVLLILIIIIKLIKNKNTSTSNIYTINKEQVFIVDADTIRISNINQEYTYTGIFEANKESKISAEIQGKINKIAVDVGDNVSEGQRLIEIDNSLLKLQLSAVEVQIEGLEKDLNRYKILTSADAIQGIQLEKTELALKSAIIQKSTLLEQINKTIIKAPYKGVVTAKFNDEGSFAAPGIPILQLSDIKQLKFNINIPEKDLARFNDKQNYSIKIDAFENLVVSAKLKMIASKSNMANNFTVQFDVINSNDLKIRSGMFGKLKISNLDSKKGIIIPTSALIKKDNKFQVYVIKNNKAQLKDITVSSNVNNKTIVVNGLNENDVIITKGFINLFEGANVSTK